MGATSNDTDDVEPLKGIWWEGSSKADLLPFPDAAKHDMGFQLHRLQMGSDPDDWKPLKNLGRGVTGVYEIRLSIVRSIFRTAYVTKFGDVIAVLHCWQKKTQATSQSDKELIVTRFMSVKERFG